MDEDNLFEHIKKVDQLHDALARDAATEEQAREQLSMLREDDDKEEKKEDDNDDEDVTMKEDEAHEPTEAADQLEAETLPQSKRKGQKRGEPHGMEEGSEENLMEGERLFAVSRISRLVWESISNMFFFSSFFPLLPFSGG